MLVSDAIPVVRTKLGHPSHSKVRNSDIIITFGQVMATYSTKLKLVDQNHYYNKVDITLPIGKADSIVNVAPNYSRALSFEYINPSYPNEAGPEILITNWQDIDQFRGETGFARTIVGDGSQYEGIARAVAFQGFPPSLMVRVTPEPSVAHKYRFWFEPANELITSPSAQVTFPAEFFNLLCYACAIELLAHCGYTPEEYGPKYQSLKIGFDRCEENIDWWKGDNKQQSARTRQPYRPPRSNTFRNGRF